jgi:hypothetical protein
MKTACTLLLLIFGLGTAFAQPDIKHSINLSDHHCLLRGTGFSNFLLKYVCHSNGSFYGVSKQGGLNTYEAVLYRYNAQHDTLWSKKYGGSQSDEIEFIHELPNGDLLLTGTTQSKDGDVWYGHTYSAKELWVLRVDTNGNIIKGTTFGGSNGSDLYCTIISSDNYIYMSGNTLATDYDFAAPPGGWLDGNGWIAKMDFDLNLVWTRVFAGNDADDAYGITELAKNKFLVSIGTGSTNIEMLGNQAKGSGDGVIFCIDSNKNTVWANRYGCSSGDDLQGCVVSPDKQRLYFIGRSSRADLDVHYQTQMYKFNHWVMITDTNGTILHSKAYGSSEMDMFLADKAWHQGHLWILGRTSGGGGDVDYGTPNPNRERTWIGMLDTQANLVAKYTMYMQNGIVLPQNFFINGSDLYINLLASASQAVPYNPYGCDTFYRVSTIYKIGMAPLSVSSTHKEQVSGWFTVYPNPGSGCIEISLQNNKLQEQYRYKIMSLDGKPVQQGVWPYGEKNMNLSVSEWPAGQYIIQLDSGNIVSQEYFIKF